MVRSLKSLEEEYGERTPASRAQWERGKPVMPGGIIKGAYWMSPYPLYVDRAQDCYLWDLDGHKYVDFANHHSAMVLGHRHPAVAEAVRKAVEMGFGLGHPTALEAEIAEEIVSRFPSIDKIRYTNSGTESSLHATRLVRAVTGKPKIAKFEGAYHGSHDALEVSTSPPPDKVGPADSPSPVPGQKGMSRGAADEVVILPYNQRESVELILREQQDKIAGVFYDGKPGALEIPDDFTHFVRDITKELGMLMVMDEVVSFRAGPSGYQGEVGVKPDLTVFGKTFGGGFPVGVIGGRADLMDVLDNTGEPTGLSQSGTFSGNHFTLAAGLATLKALTPKVYEHLDGLRERLHGGLTRTFASAGVPCQVLSAGSIVNPYVTDQSMRDYRSSLTVDIKLFHRISLALILKGYAIGNGPMMMMLSAPMEDSHIDGLIEALTEVLEEED